MKNVLLIVFLWLMMPAFAQEQISAKLMDKIPFNEEQFVGIDKFGNTFSIHKNTLYKHDQQADKTYQFYDIQLGKLTSVDLINPLKITLFYRDMNTVVLVDNRLNEIKRINFNTLATFRNVGFATTANNQSLWIFNVDLQQLERFDYNRNAVIQHTQPIAENILHQQSNFNFCWLLTQNHLQQYNSYGSLLQEFERNQQEAIRESNGNLISLKANQLSILLKETSDFIPISISEIAVKDFYFNNENLYLYDGEFLFTYHLNLPK